MGIFALQSLTIAFSTSINHYYIISSNYISIINVEKATAKKSKHCSLQRDGFGRTSAGERHTQTEGAVLPAQP